MRHDPQHHLEALLREEPYMRSLARLLGAGNADEILQQTWLHACEYDGRDVDQPRAWLGRIMRNVTKNLARGEQRRRRREGDAPPRGPAPSSVELMQREERRLALVKLVDSLPAEQREIVLLRYFEGLAPREIADRLELPPDKVWGLHRRAIEKLRRELDNSAQLDGQADRRAWLLPLSGALTRIDSTPLTPVPNAIPLGLLTGTVAMTLKTKIVAAAAVLAAVALVVWWPNDTSPAVLPNTTTAATSPDSARGDIANDGVLGDIDPDKQMDREAVIPTDGATSPTTGTLEVRIYHAGADKLAAADVTLNLRRARSDIRLARRFVADATGLVRIESLEPGRVSVWSDRFDNVRGADITAGETTNLELTLPIGMLLRGRVIDQDERPVPGARIEVVMPHLLGRDPEALATTDSEGKFEILGAPQPSMVGARAAGYRASDLKFAFGDEGQELDITLRVTPGGGIVEGTVVDTRGEPIEQAIVCVGEGKVQGVGRGDIENQPALPAFLRTDEFGRFRAVGLAPGDNPVWVRAREKAPWRGSCVVADYGTTTLRITMPSGSIAKGRVVTAAGKPVAGAEVMHGYWGDIAHVFAHTDDGGNYELRGLPTGAVVLKAEHDNDGKIERTVDLVGGRETTVDLVISKGLELTGTVRDENDQPVAKVAVQVDAHRTAQAEGWLQFTRTDDTGRFAIPNCPADRELRVKLTHDDFTPRTLDAIRPSQGALEIRLQRADRSSRISGILVGPDGKPLSDIRVTVRCQGRDRYYEPVVTAADGKFGFDELPTGQWSVWFRTRDYPSPRIEARDLGPNGHWDLGTVQFETGGRAIIRPTSAPAADLRFMIADTQSSARWSMSIQDTDPTTPILRPGDYRLMAWGKNIAAQALSFTIIAGERTEIPLHTEPGVHQRLEFSYDTKTKVSQGGTLSVYRGGEKIVDRWVPTKKGEPFGYDLWLLPGTYRITLAGRLRGEAELTIDENASSPFAIELR